MKRTFGLLALAIAILVVNAGTADAFWRNRRCRGGVAVSVGFGTTGISVGQYSIGQPIMGNSYVGNHPSAYNGYSQGYSSNGYLQNRYYSQMPGQSIYQSPGYPQAYPFGQSGFYTPGQMFYR